MIFIIPLDPLAVVHLNLPQPGAVRPPLDLSLKLLQPSRASMNGLVGRES